MDILDEIRLESAKSEIIQKRRGIDITPPIRASIRNENIKKKTDPTHIPVDVIGINISEDNRYIYLTETASGTRKYKLDKEVRFL
jgi:hypothetical protein